jgi:hypothetical protein
MPMNSEPGFGYWTLNIGLNPRLAPSRSCPGPLRLQPVDPQTFRLEIWSSQIRASAFAFPSRASAFNPGKSFVSIGVNSWLKPNLIRKSQPAIRPDKLSVSLFSLSKEIKMKPGDKEINKEIPGAASFPLSTSEMEERDPGRGGPLKIRNFQFHQGMKPFQSLSRAGQSRPRKGLYRLLKAYQAIPRFSPAYSLGKAFPASADSQPRTFILLGAKRKLWTLDIGLGPSAALRSNPPSVLNPKSRFKIQKLQIATGKFLGDTIRPLL